MRVTLLHNPEAGEEEEHRRDELVSLLAAGGHDVRYQSTKQGSWEDVLNEPAELVVAAGGDGTVIKVFKRLAGSGTPVTILPAGSANNIARTLGFADVDLAVLVRGWPRARTRRYDTWTATAGQRKLFVECMGAGLFGKLLDRAAELAAEPQGDDKVALSLRLLTRVLEEAEPLSCEVTLDGVDLSGEYLAVEAMNARELGPNLPLAPDADPADGVLEVVLVAPGERAALADYVAARLDGDEPDPPALTVRRGRRLRLEASGEPNLHVDDDLWPGCRAVEVSVSAPATVLGP